jgi:hypothetical protein
MAKGGQGSRMACQREVLYMDGTGNACFRGVGQWDYAKAKLLNAFCIEPAAPETLSLTSSSSATTVTTPPLHYPSYPGRAFGGQYEAQCLALQSDADRLKSTRVSVST